MTLRELLKTGTDKLEKAGVENAGHDARELLMHTFGMDAAGMLMQLNRELRCDEEDQSARLLFEADIARRAERIPLQHILGSTWFMGLEFRVDPSVLIPRQDTEVLVETVLKRESDKRARVLDLCTGSGCIAISLKKLGQYESVTAADISRAALDTAAGNAALNGVSVRFIESDLFDALDGVFDVIVSNPPYIASAQIAELQPEVREHDPLTALDGGADGLDFYRSIIRQAAEHLSPDGRIYFEIGYDQAEAVSGLLEENGFAGVEVCRDLGGLDRVVRGGRQIARNRQTE